MNICFGIIKRMLGCCCVIDATLCVIEKLLQLTKESNMLELGGNWRQEDQMLNVYPKPGEILLGFLVHRHKTESEYLMCPRCHVVYDQKMSEMFDRVPFS